MGTDRVGHNYVGNWRDVLALLRLDWPGSISVGGRYRLFQLSRADLDKVMTLRAQIKDALAAGQRRAAYEAETQAMSILGYKRIATRCGPGESSWRKIDKEEGGTFAEASPIS